MFYYGTRPDRPIYLTGVFLSGSSKLKSSLTHKFSSLAKSSFAKIASCLNQYKRFIFSRVQNKLQNANSTDTVQLQHT